MKVAQQLQQLQHQQHFELSLVGCVSPAALPRLLEGLELSCGPAVDYCVFETAMALDKADVRLRFQPYSPKKTMHIFSYGAALRVTSRPDQQTALPQVMYRPVTVIAEGGADHIRALQQAGFQKKFHFYHQGKVFYWGRVQITVTQIFASPSTSPADFTKRMVAPDWYVRCSVITTTESSEDGANMLLQIQKVLAMRVTLTKSP